MWSHMKLLQHEFEGYVQYGLSDIIEKINIILECQIFLAYYLESTLS